MTERGPGDGDDPSFEDLVPDVKPLTDRARQTGRSSDRSPRAPRRPPRPPVVFEIERHGEQIRGLAAGTDRRTLRRLRAGAFTVERSLDLHRLEAVEAKRTLHGGVVLAWEEGIRCLLVIHGRGRHSEGEAVLQPSLGEWLVQPPVDAIVMAFASALPRDGGPGATYVLLRRKRGGGEPASS